MADERRGPDPAAARQRELDQEVEELVRRIADVVNSAGEENRQDLREYAISLLRDRTEQAVAAEVASAPRTPGFNPLAFAFLLLLVSLPLLVLFTPLGLGLVVAAVLMGVWGLVATWFGRS